MFNEKSVSIDTAVVIYIIISGPIAGILADKYGCRLIGMIGGIFMCAGCIISSFATSVPYLYFSYGVITGKINMSYLLRHSRASSTHSSCTNIIILKHHNCFVIPGLGASMLIASTFVIIGHYFDKRKGTAMGLSSVGCGLGTFAFPPMLTGLIQTFRFEFLILPFSQENDNKKLRTCGTFELFEMYSVPFPASWGSAPS